MCVGAACMNIHISVGLWVFFVWSSINVGSEYSVDSYGLYLLSCVCTIVIVYWYSLGHECVQLLYCMCFM